MTDQKNGKGFAGFDDLVSDISKDIEQATKADDSQSTGNQPLYQSPSQGMSSPQTLSPTQQPLRTTSTPGACSDPIVQLYSSGSVGKWVIGIIIAVIVIAFWISGMEKMNESSYVPRPEQSTASAPAPAPTFVPEKPSVAQPPRFQPKIPPKTRKEKSPEVIAPSPVPAPPITDSKHKEILPPVGTSHILSRDQIRYCLSEDIRMGAMKEAVNRYSGTEVDQFNAIVQDYNSRCGQFRYRKGALESVRSEVEAVRGQLEVEGIARVDNWR